MLTAKELIEKVKKYHSNFDQDLLLKAYEFGKNAHSSQVRSSGDAYFTHPIAVAEILINLKLDIPSIITALLHDTVEDTSATLEQIEKIFGANIANLVDGVTKLTKIEALPSSRRTAENFRKLVMAMSQDIRVLLVKLADRLHNMRTLDYIPSAEKRIAIANESLEIYAPLAARIGMYEMRDELQELSFAQINPEAQNYIIENLNELRAKKKDVIEKIIAELKSKIAVDIKDFEVHGREKKPYSIWVKMKKNLGFHHLNDIMAFRIIVSDLPTCYQALGIINCNYNMIPGTFKDYISTPKDNKYQSIHLAILGPENKKIEIQIRTKEMHLVSELGLAAHWSYKQEIKPNKESEQYGWIRELISLFEHSTDASEVLKNHKIQMHKDQVFCFTPTGDIFNLPIGATIVDFAYAIHSEIGNCCVSAKVNGAIAPLRQKLENGDQIEIITNKNNKPSPNWLQFVTTSKAKAAIKHFIRNEKYNEYSALGRSIINKFFASKDLEISDKLLEKILGEFNKKTVSDLCVFIAEGLISRYDILKAVYPDYQDDAKKKSAKEQQAIEKRKEHKYSIPIEGLVPGMAIHFGGCCNPIPGDNICGVINTGTGITIHNQTCPNLKAIAINPQRLVDVCWKEDASSGKELYHSRIKVAVENKAGSLANISSAIAKKKVNIGNIRIVNRSADYFELVIDLEVKNIGHLEEIISSLKMSNKIIEVYRYDG